MLAHVDAEQQNVQKLRRGGHEVDDYPGTSADNGAFVGTDPVHAGPVGVQHCRKR